MARFMGIVHGNRGQASRLGSKDSGMEVRCNGWDLGVRVVAYAEGDNDVFAVYANGGSNGRGFPVMLGTVTAGRNGPVFTPDR